MSCARDEAHFTGVNIAGIIHGASSGCG